MIAFVKHHCPENQRVSATRGPTTHNDLSVSDDGVAVDADFQSGTITVRADQQRELLDERTQAKPHGDSADGYLLIEEASTMTRRMQRPRSP